MENIVDGGWGEDGGGGEGLEKEMEGIYEAGHVTTCTRNSLCWNKLGRPEARARKLGRSTFRQSAELPFAASGRDALIM